MHFLVPELIHQSLQGHKTRDTSRLPTNGSDLKKYLFGFNSSFDGPNHVDRFKNELDAFLKHSKNTQYDSTNLRIALISPTAVQAIENITNGRYQNRNLKVYVDAMSKVAQSNNVMFIDAFTPSLEWYKEGKELSMTVPFLQR